MLTFHLAGINNQNFLMRDDQTGTFWQQINGKAVSGPLKGSQLELVYSDELTFAQWRQESADGTVLKPVAQYAAQYETKDWDVRMERVRTVLDFPKTELKSRDLVVGIESSGASRAYPVNRIISDKLIEDRVGSSAILVALGPDGKSIRAFEKSGDAASEFYLVQKDLMMDSATGSHWSFAGCAVDGPRKGSCLKAIPATKDYWFDWRNYHPDTTVFRR